MAAAETRFDVIFIGSGMGALAGASIFAQLYGKRVLVLERHFKIGGFTHIFKRKGKYEWDVGLHYVGRMQKGQMGRAMFDYITRGGVKWNPMPDPYDVFLYPDLTFPAHAGRERLKQDLIARFPGERKALEQYFSDMKRAVGWFGRYNIALTLPPPMGAVASLLRSAGAKTALMTTGEYLDRHFRDPKLKAVLVSQWGDYGLPPSLSAFAMHALIADHYIEGGFYPVGASKTIADSIIPIVESAGGQMLVNHFVDEIIIENGRATGVKVREKKGEEFIEKEYFAEVIISDAGAYNTYQRLLPQNYPLPFREELQRFPRGTATVTLYLGLKEDPRGLGFKGENYWLYASYDHDRIFEERNQLINGKVGGAYLSFPSLKNPLAGAHTAEIIAFMDAEPFQSWAAQPWKQRDEAYQQLKEKISHALLDFVAQRFPGFQEIIDYRELSTPLSTEFFTGHPRGSIYGLPAVPQRYRLKWLGYHTPVRNLYLTGADTAGHGIMGALIAGAVVAGVVAGAPKAIRQIFKEAKQYSASLA